LIGKRKTAEDLNVSAENAPTCNIEIVEIWMGGSGWGDRNSVFPEGNKKAGCKEPAFRKYLK
jgi:hypothetical protein